MICSLPLSHLQLLQFLNLCFFPSISKTSRFYKLKADNSGPPWYNSTSLFNLFLNVLWLVQSHIVDSLYFPVDFNTCWMSQDQSGKQLNKSAPISCHCLPVLTRSFCTSPTLPSTRQHRCHRDCSASTFFSLRNRQAIMVMYKSNKYVVCDLY